jgi:hypothetical protein
MTSPHFSNAKVLEVNPWSKGAVDLPLRTGDAILLLTG